MSYMTISSQENHHFSLCSYFHAHPTTLLLKILGGTNAWAVPHLKFFGRPSPQSPLGLRPCLARTKLLVVLFERNCAAVLSPSSSVTVVHRLHLYAILVFWDRIS